MIILKIYIDNIYMFDGFEASFTFPRKADTALVTDEFIPEAPKIRYKKVNIFMGGNAAGKTTFGKVLMEMNNFLSGRETKILRKRYHRNRESSIKILYVVGEILFEYELSIYPDETFKECIRHAKLYPSYNLKDVMSRIQEKEFAEYRLMNISNIESDIPIVSTAVREYYIEEIDKTALQYTQVKNAFYFNFSTLTEKRCAGNKAPREALNVIDQVLKIIDPSIKQVRAVYSKKLDEKDEKREQDYYVEFRNGERTLITEGEFGKAGDKRLSQGTIEAIDIASILSHIYAYPGVIYLDEQMAYMHTNLSNALIGRLIMELPKGAQLFITSHNENILDLNIPVHSYAFLVREADKIKVITLKDSVVSRNGRELMEHIQNDCFGTNPDLDSIWDIDLTEEDTIG